MISASMRNRRRLSASLAFGLLRNFKATLRFKSSPSAMKTSPSPPAAWNSRSRKVAKHEADRGGTDGACFGGPDGSFVSKLAVGWLSSGLIAQGLVTASKLLDQLRVLDTEVLDRDRPTLIAELLTPYQQVVQERLFPSGVHHQPLREPRPVLVGRWRTALGPSQLELEGQ